MNESETHAEDSAHLRSLMSVAMPHRTSGAVPERSKGDTRAAQLTAKYRGKGIRGRPWTNLKKLAQQHSFEALEKLAELVDCDNDCVALGASKLLVRLSAPDRGPGKRERKKQKEKRVNVIITHFGKGKEDAQRS